MSNHPTTEALADETARRVRQQKRAIDAGLDRERELRVALMHERNRSSAAEGRRDLLDAEVTLEKTRAESAEARVEELTEENARLEQEAKVAELRKSPAEQEIKALSNERDTLRRRVRWLEGQLKVRDHNIDHQAGRIRQLTKELRIARDDMESHLQADDIVDAENDAVRAAAVPRVIRVDELRVGQTIIAYQLGGNDTASLGVITELQSYNVQLGEHPRSTLWTDHDNANYILLRDAPKDANEEEPEDEGTTFEQAAKVVEQAARHIAYAFPQRGTTRPTGSCDCGCGATP